LGLDEVWGSRSIYDPLADFFKHQLERNRLIDVPPIKLCPTWRNNRVGEERIAKRLDCFLFSKSLLSGQLHFQQWVGSGGHSDHYPILLELARGMRKPATPFKCNSKWFKEESFIEMVKELWIPFDSSLGEPTSVHFLSNIKKVKQVAITWAHQKRAREEHELKEIEEALDVIYVTIDGGLSSQESKYNLIRLEKTKRKILEDKEAAWRLKSRVIWMEKGNENTKFFQAYSKGRKLTNTIWSMKNSQGREVSTFEELAKLGENHFSSLFKSNNISTMA
jgi:hypothetical protein